MEELYSSRNWVQNKSHLTFIININYYFVMFTYCAGNVGPNTQFNDASLLDDAWMQILLSDPITQMNGFCCITDCKGLNSSILKWLIPKNCKVGAAKLESLPIKEWTIHIVNMNTFFRACVYVIKPFLRKSTIAKVCFRIFLTVMNIKIFNYNFLHTTFLHEI